MSSINSWNVTETLIDQAAVDDLWLCFDTSTGRTGRANTAQAQADVIALTGSSTGQTLLGTGTSVINSTAASTYVLAPPTYTGQIKNIVETASATIVRTVVGSTVGGATFLDSTKTTLTFSAQGQAVILKAITATQWMIMSNVGTVASSA